MEGHRIPRLQRPADDIVFVLMGVDIRQGAEPGVLVKLSAIETGRTELLLPAMRPANATQRGGLRHRVQRDPEADVLPAGDAIVRLVMMPGSHRAASGGFDQRMLMEKFRRLRLHKRRGDLRGRRLEDKLAKRRDPRPVAVILKKRRRTIFGDHRARMTIFAGAGHQRRDPLGEALDPGGKNALQ
ncbi:Uncharacterised protein [Klebsiella pneumoniae]|nr:Uncharacterised protein [Klebsiella pneumoniae]